ncbi:hypothetical protein PGRAN_09066 [Listeria grandensis FSL F6-0971]|uniref:Uncharacterized protein n=1 Tax=Listeria grandensis FSL F6-0971 TaxID=1265819 RepID=W7BBC5_9LIST|nr:hypothetical protein PGRAN_09066 [Listeria grandensis FSL F6-0971]
MSTIYNDKNSFVVTAENKKVVCIELVNEVPNQNFSTEKNIKLGSTFKEITAACGAIRGCNRVSRF